MTAGLDPAITDPRIATARMTCRAYPTQWEGTLTDGRVWYLRFRHAELTLGIGADQDEAVRNSGSAAGAERDLSETHGDDAGTMEDGEIDLWLTVLLDELLVPR